jgi:hypothetical protein
MYQPGPSSDLQRAVASAIHEHWVLFLIEGIVHLHSRSLSAGYS